MPQVEASVKKSEKYALRLIDIKNWSSPVAAQYKIRSIPHFILFDPSGKEIDQGFESVFRTVADPSAVPEKSPVVRRIVAVGIFLAGLMLLKSSK